MVEDAFFILFFAYLIGAFPSAYLIGRLTRGEDIRKLGDGNMGAKNTWHSVGRRAGLGVGGLDIAKGALAVSIAQRHTSAESLVLLAGALAVLGHDLSPFVGFRGGQGMATLAGVFLVLFSRSMLPATCFFLLLLLLTRSWDWSAGAGFLLLFALLWLNGETVRRLIYALLLVISLLVTKLVQSRRRRELLV